MNIIALYKRKKEKYALRAYINKGNITFYCHGREIAQSLTPVYIEPSEAQTLIRSMLNHSEEEVRFDYY